MSLSQRKGKKKDTGRRVKFKKADYEKFARKLDKWGDTLSPEERALLLVVLDKSTRTAAKTGPDAVHTTSTVETTVAAEFDLGQLIVQILLAIQGIEAVVEEDGPSWIMEVTATTKA